MKTKHFLIVLLPLFCTMTSCKKNNVLIGKWEEYKVEWVDTSEHSDPESFKLRLEFKNKSKMINYMPGSEWEYNYVLKNETIFVENEPCYLIEKSTKEDLVIVNYRKFKSLSSRRYYLKPVTKFD